VLNREPGVIAMCLEGRGAVGKLLLCSGPASASDAKRCGPTTLRARWGTDSTSNGIHASSSISAAEKELQAFFPDGAMQLQRTLCIVKPDAMSHVLEIRAEIDTFGFTILKEKQVHLKEDRAKDFYREHNDKPFFVSLVKEACSGPCCVMVLYRLEAIAVWEQIMGPESIREARRLRPGCLRARFGRDGQRNAVHGSASVKNAGREVRFFFPELGSDPPPTNDQVRDFLFRKTAVASMDLKTLSDADSSSLAIDPTIQQLLSRGLLSLCQVQRKGTAAVKWLSQWLAENNPNKNVLPSGGSDVFAPPERTKKFIEYGVNKEGLPFVVEAPPEPTKRKQVIDMDVSEEPEDHGMDDSGTAPLVVFFVGGPGTGKTQHCVKLCEDFNCVRLSAAELMSAEEEAHTSLGTEITKHRKNGSILAVPDAITIKLLKVAMQKHKDTNRFLIDDFPLTVDQAKLFEQEIAQLAFVIFLDGSKDAASERVADKSESGAPAHGSFDERWAIYQENANQVINYYHSIGKVRSTGVDGTNEEDVYATIKQYLSCRFIYLLSPPGAPAAALAERLQEKYGYSAIHFTSLLKEYAKSGQKDCAKVAQALAAAQPVDSSIACPLLVSEIFRDMAVGVQNFVLCGFPQNQKQALFLENRIHCTSKTLLLEFSRADAADLAVAASDGSDMEELELRTQAFFATKFHPRTVRIPCSLEVAESMGSTEASTSSQGPLVEACWANIRDKVVPSLTIVLGPPCSGTGILATELTTLTPNTHRVDCNELLDKELERRTPAASPCIIC